MSAEEDFQRFLIEYRERTKKNIEEVGQSVIGVVGGEYPFCYTVGNRLRGLPDMLLIGCVEMSILNDAAVEMVRRGAPFAEGEKLSLYGEEYAPLLVVDATNDPRTKDEYTCQASNYYESEDYRVLQLVMPDKERRFPGEPDCEEPYRDIPVLSGSPSKEKLN